MLRSAILKSHNHVKVNVIPTHQHPLSEPKIDAPPKVLFLESVCKFASRGGSGGLCETQSVYM